MKLSSVLDWQDWVSATDTRNFLIQDPLLDWLELYGEEKGFQRDTDLPGYDPRTDFTKFIFEKTREFEAGVIAYLKTITTISTITSGASDARKSEKFQETFAAMEAGVPLIYQGVLWDTENRTYGIPDLLIRSDELIRLVPSALTRDDAAQGAKDLKAARGGTGGQVLHSNTHRRRGAGVGLESVNEGMARREVVRPRQIEVARI